MRGAEGVSYTEMLAWSQLRQITLHQWEIDVIHSLDNIYWSVINE